MHTTIQITSRIKCKTFYSALDYYEFVYRVFFLSDLILGVFCVLIW